MNEGINVQYCTFFSRAFLRQEFSVDRSSIFLQRFLKSRVFPQLKSRKSTFFRLSSFSLSEWLSAPFSTDRAFSASDCDFDCNTADASFS